MADVVSEGRAAIHAVARAPRSTLAVVLTLGLGIASTTAVYAVFNHLLFRPVPGVADPASLVTITFQPEDSPRTFASGSAQSIALFRDPRAGLISVASSNGAPRPEPVNLRPDEDPRVLDVEYVAPDYLETLGVRTRLGRLFSTEETREGGHGVALISDALWRREFSGRADVLTKALAVNGKSFVIIGVVDAYRGWSYLKANTGDVWLPERDSGGEITRGDRVSTLVARTRTRPDASAIQARLRAVYAPVRATLTGDAANIVPSVHTGLGFGVEPTLGVSFSLVIGIASLLTLLSCANAAERRQDLALRAAIGASRWQLIRGLAIEAVAMAGAAVAMGLLLTRAIARLLEGVRVFVGVDALTEVGVDWRVAAFACATGAVTVCVFALTPILSASRIDLRTVLQEASRAATGRQRLRRTLVAAQVALSLVLMAGGGLFVRSLWNLRAIDVGVNPSGVFAFTLNPRLVGARGAEGEVLVARAIERLRRLPGTIAVATANPHPFWDSRMMARVRLETEAADPILMIETSVVSPDYFQTLGVPVLSGRVFDATDARAPAGTLATAGIVNVALARALFGTPAAVGRRLAVGGLSGEWRRRRVVEIVGVVGDTRTAYTLRRPEPAFMLYQATGTQLVFSRVYVRSALPPGAAQARVMQAVHEIEPRLPLVEPGTLSSEIEQMIPEDRALARLLVAVAVVATLLGFAGVYAVTAFGVVERTREFGVRIALGASRAAVLRTAGSGVAGAAAGGALVGLAGCMWATRFVASRLYGVTALDPVSITAAIALLGFVVIVAAWLPARQAMRVDPIRALRHE